MTFLFSKVTEHVSSDIDEAHISLPLSPNLPTNNGYKKWWRAAKQIFPLYIASYVAIAVINILAVMSIQKPYDPRRFPFTWLWEAWKHWDTNWYIDISQIGYAKEQSTAFFPLYPLLMHLSTYVLRNSLLSGLVIAGLAMLVAFCVLYQLVLEEFGEERATRIVVYLAVFPTGFFLAAAYNTSLALSLALLSFYAMRRGKWWLAGMFGLFASLNRAAGVLLVAPLLYEYLRQHQFRLREMRLNIASVLLIPSGVAIYGLYCYYRFQDFLAFSHVEIIWGRTLRVPWYGIVYSIAYIQSSPSLLSYQSLNNFLNLIPDISFLVLTILAFVGPWRFPRSQWSYAIYAALFWLFVNLVPVGGSFPLPLASDTRYFLECFPYFILLASWGKSRAFHFIYLFFCAPIAVYLLIHHLLGLPVI